ncbi:MAG: hypothetical protein JXB45_00900 [Candidatus Krumholzibacteriota bacterium]|nr:hypothetical protein [Candidatus Krumholzibacteriota bacterium]
MERDITILGTIHIAWGALGMIGSIILFITIAGAGVISGDYHAMRTTELVASCIAFPLFILSIPGILGGIGLLRYTQWGRILLIIVGFINLLNIPFGTILGIFTVNFLLSGRKSQWYASRSRERASLQA